MAQDEFAKDGVHLRVREMDKVRKGWHHHRNVPCKKPGPADSLIGPGVPVWGQEQYKGSCRDRSEDSGQPQTLLGSVGDPTTALEGEGWEESGSWGSGRHTRNTLLAAYRVARVFCRQTPKRFRSSKASW